MECPASLHKWWLVGLPLPACSSGWPCVCVYIDVDVHTRVHTGVYIAVGTCKHVVTCVYRWHIKKKRKKNLIREKCSTCWIIKNKIAS